MILWTDSLDDVEKKLREALDKVDWIGEIPLDGRDVKRLKSIVKQWSKKIHLIPSLTFLSSLVFCAQNHQYTEDERFSFWKPYAEEVFDLNYTKQNDNKFLTFQNTCREHFQKCVSEIIEAGYNHLFFFEHTQVVKNIYLHAIIPSYLIDDFADLFITLLHKYPDIDIDTPVLEILDKLKTDAKNTQKSKRLIHFFESDDTIETAKRLIEKLLMARYQYMIEGLSQLNISNQLISIENLLWKNLAPKLENLDLPTVNFPREQTLLPKSPTWVQIGNELCLQLTRFSLLSKPYRLVLLTDEETLQNYRRFQPLTPTYQNGSYLINKIVLYDVQGYHHIHILDEDDNSLWEIGIPQQSLDSDNKIIKSKRFFNISIVGQTKILSTPPIFHFGDIYLEISTSLALDNPDVRTGVWFDISINGKRTYHPLSELMQDDYCERVGECYRLNFWHIMNHQIGHYVVKATYRLEPLLDEPIEFIILPQNTSIILPNLTNYYSLNNPPQIQLSGISDNQFLVNVADYMDIQHIDEDNLVVTWCSLEPLVIPIQFPFGSIVLACDVKWRAVEFNPPLDNGVLYNYDLNDVEIIIHGEPKQQVVFMIDDQDARPIQLDAKGQYYSRLKYDPISDALRDRSSIVTIKDLSDTLAKFRFYYETEHQRRERLSKSGLLDLIHSHPSIENLNKWRICEWLNYFGEDAVNQLKAKYYNSRTVGHLIKLPLRFSDNGMVEIDIIYPFYQWQNLTNKIRYINEPIQIQLTYSNEDWRIQIKSIKSDSYVFYCEQCNVFFASGNIPDKHEHPIVNLSLKPYPVKVDFTELEFDQFLQHPFHLGELSLLRNNPDAWYTEQGYLFALSQYLNSPNRNVVGKFQDELKEIFDFIVKSYKSYEPFSSSCLSVFLFGMLLEKLKAYESVTHYPITALLTLAFVSRSYAYKIEAVVEFKDIFPEEKVLRSLEITRRTCPHLMIWAFCWIETLFLLFSDKP